jgi:hypothetical protein
MEFMKIHLNDPDIVSFSSTDALREYVTCTKPVRTDTHWTCVKGAYDLMYDIPATYDYKIMKTIRVPSVAKKFVFELTNKDHILVDIQFARSPSEHTMR